MVFALQSQANPWVPEILQHLPQLNDQYVQQNKLRVQAAHADADLLEKALQANSVTWQMFVRAVVELGQLSPQRIRFATGSSASSVSRWLSGKVQPHEKVRAKTAQQLIDAVRHRAGPGK